MSKYDKKLKKALAQFESGNYEAALDICEKVLDKDYNNEEALLIEGRSLEKLERMNDAIVSWKINSEYNNNEEAREKLDKFNNIDEKKLAMSTIFSTSMKDEIKAKLQEEAKKEFSKQLDKRDNESETPKNEQAPVIEMKKDSPKVNDEKTFEVKKEEVKPVANVTKVDFTKKEDIKEEKTEEPRVISTPSFVNEHSNSKKSNKKKKPVKFVAIAVSGVIVLSLAYGITKNMKSTSAAGNDSAIADNSKDDTTNKTDNNSTDNSSNKENTTDNKTFNIEDLNKAIEGKDYSAIAKTLSTTPKDKVPADALDSYTKAEDLMKEEGVRDLYLKGSDLLKDKKYEEALKDFENAYAYSDGSYLRPHLIYFMGASYKNLDKNTDAIKYFKEYLQDYKAKPDAEDVMYTPQSIYNLAVLYKEEGNTAEAKKYAQEIEDNYPDSMFYNDVTKKIIYG